MTIAVETRTQAVSPLSIGIFISPAPKLADCTGPEPCGIVKTMPNCTLPIRAAFQGNKRIFDIIA
jgi:hypothetical protein